MLLDEQETSLRPHEQCACEVEAVTDLDEDDLSESDLGPESPDVSELPGHHDRRRACHGDQTCEACQSEHHDEKRSLQSSEHP